jgi:hypothetical protein
MKNMEERPQKNAEGRSPIQVAGDNSSHAKRFAQDAAERVGIGKSHSLFTLILVSIAASSVIATYVLVVGRFSIHRIETDTMGDATLQAARELCEIRVEHPSLGAISLCDWRQSSNHMVESQKHPPRSIACVRETFAKIQQVAKLVGVEAFDRMAKRDAETVKELESHLADSLQATTAAGNGPPNSRNSSSERAGADTGRVYEHVHSLLQSHLSPTETALTDLKISLGLIDDAKEVSFSARPSQRRINVSYAGRGPISLVDPSLFKPVPPHRAPNLVLVEATFSLKQKGEGTPLAPWNKKACALIRATPTMAPPSVFAITFPHGMPPFAHSIIDLLKYDGWRNKGLWRQAIGNEVPGRGSLAPPLEPSLPQMDPGEALAVQLYDWLKYIGSDLQADAVAACFLEKFSNGPKIGTALAGRNAASFGVNDDQVNSCIAKDTGAREYAVMHQCNPGGVGQSALSKALLIKHANELTAGRANFPANALPLFVNGDGYCNLAGRKSFDERLVRNFFRDLYETNLAALETVSTAKSLHAQSVIALSQINQKEVVERQELASLTNRLSRLVRDKQREQDNHSELSPLPIRLTQDRITDLEMLIKSDEEQRKQNLKLHFLANLTQQNASRVQSSTYDICANSLRLCRDGLFSINWGGYLIGKNNVFMPITRPMAEADFYEAIASNLVSETYQPYREALPFDPTDLSAETKNIREAQIKNPAFAWIRKDLRVLLPPEQGFLEPSKVLVDGVNWQSATSQSLARVNSCMVVFDADELKRPVASGKPMPRLYGNYPFGNMALPLGQLLYYCAKAANTGKQPTVSWSVLARNFVAYHGQLSNNSSATEFAGTPREASESNWFKPSDLGLFQKSPGLACEFEIRTPLPLFEHPIEDSHLTNPVNNTQTAEIPPVPPDML